MSTTSEDIYKICERDEWESAAILGRYAGSADDLRDGFIHFSYVHQLPRTAAKYFRDRADLVLIAVDATALGPALRVEATSSKDAFPHLYAELPLTAVRWVRSLPWDVRSVRGSMGTAHVIVGSTGAGKSTYATKLANEQGAVRFVIDEWMTTLFSADKPEAPGFDWYMPRVLRCTEMIWQAAEQTLNAGMSVVLEIGLTLREDRERFYARAAAAAVPVQLHVIEADVTTRWQRVDARNRRRGETYSLEVTRGMFDFVETLWEPPDDEELGRYNGRRVRTE